MRPAWLLATALTLAGCAATPRPSVMGRVEDTRDTAAVREAAQLAPQAYLAAEQLRGRAERAYDAGDFAGAQITSEHALAAYHHAVVLARLVKANQRRLRAETERSALQAELAKLEAEQRLLNAEADQLELRAKVARDALPLATSGPASPDRERARREAARALLTQARLLCVAARLVDADGPGLSQTLAELDAATTQLKAPQAPIDAAASARAKCLAQLTLARRPATQQAPAQGAADALLAELTRSGDWQPFRDDRGVVVTLRGLVTAGGEVTQDGRGRLTTLANVAKAHPSFPVLVVVHTSGAGNPERDLARGRALAEVLRSAGAPRVEAESAGSDLPVLEPRRADSKARNERVEIIFVAPQN